MTEQNEEMHIGIIRVSRNAFSYGDNELNDILTIDNTDIQGKMRDDGIFSRMHRLLMLPESYKIIAIMCEGPRLWKIFVESDIIPFVALNGPFPEVSPTYQSNDDGSVSLSSIEITTRQCGVTLDEMLRMNGYSKQVQKEGTKA